MRRGMPGRKKWERQFSALFASVLVVAFMSTPAAAKNKQPNFLIIVADDMAYSDIGAFGGEIDTPNLNALAYEGARFTNFQVSPTCSPSRAMILTGNDNHQAGLGSHAELLTAEERGKPGYEGYLNNRVATIAERLRGLHYHTMLSGKWHVGWEEGHWPVDRGFERSFALPGGGDNHFGVEGGFHKNTLYVEDRTPIKRPVNKYSTDYFTDNMLTLLKESRGNKRPFFAYLAFTAPHWPLQAPKELIAKYKGRYDDGYEALRAKRIAAQKALGLLGDVTPHPMVGTKPWKSLSASEKAIEARKMEVYAAMIDSIDQNVGRVIKELKDSGRYENTIIIFTADNGAAGADYAKLGVFQHFGKFISEHYDNSLDNIGAANSLVWLGPGWGQAETAPLFLFKVFTAQGGVRAPLIVTGPGVKPGLVGNSLAHATDIAATILDFAGAQPNGVGLGPSGRLPVEGVSWKDVLNGSKTVLRGPDVELGGELFGGRDLIKGDYRAVYLNDMATNVDPSLPTSRWMLFNIRKDPGETTDLAATEPAKLAELVADWEAYAKRVGVVLPEKGAPVRRINPGDDKVLKSLGAE